MKCPKCKQEMNYEYSRYEYSKADTDRGVYWGTVYWCDTCNYECDGYDDEVCRT